MLWRYFTFECAFSLQSVIAVTLIQGYWKSWNSENWSWWNSCPESVNSNCISWCNSASLTLIGHTLRLNPNDWRWPWPHITFYGRRWEASFYFNLWKTYLTVAVSTWVKAKSYFGKGTTSLSLSVSLSIRLGTLYYWNHTLWSPTPFVFRFLRDGWCNRFARRGVSDGFGVSGSRLAKNEIIFLGLKDFNWQLKSTDLDDLS